MTSVGSPALWIAFTLGVLAILVIDLGVLNRDAKPMTFRKALIAATIFVSLSLAFAGLVYHWFGKDRALEYLTGYVLELSLSVDNLFVILVIMTFFRVPAEHQHRLLFWGILGALVLRAVFIVLGSALVQQFHFVLYVFGAFLVFTGVKLFLHDDEDSVDPEKSFFVRAVRRIIPTIPEFVGGAFIVRRDGRRVATLLLVALVMIEGTDVLFAVDSIPAIFAVTTDPFIVYTSNICAILGLRSLYFLLAGMMDRFRFLKVGLAVVLTFVGVKMLIVDLIKIPIEISLMAIGGVLVISVVASLWFSEPTSKK
ncbi:MAG: TerC family protein [Deltaproteobacteria bacterium]|nr:TerC family protein [Deltaproteobacteria bacterium]